MFEFQFPYGFILLPLPVLVFWFTTKFKETGDAVKVPFLSKIGALTDKEPRKGDTVITKTWFEKLMFLLCWCLLIIGLARPVLFQEPIIWQNSGRDLLLIVDLSGSMEAVDFRTPDGTLISRLDAVKQVVEEFVDRRASDRIGLAVFGDAAFPQVPFTLDHTVLKELLAEVQPGMAGPKTMIGDAIGLGLKMFEGSESENKVAILLTDGNDTGSKMPVDKAASIAAGNNVIIHTIAMGDPESVGETALDLEKLDNIAALTGGKSFLALDTAQLENVYTALDALEPEKVETVSYTPLKPLFLYFVYAMITSVIILLIVMLVPKSKRSRS
ncbi:VWA domain-containing protein [Sneathiella marina]|uniref:VWA domain-containing protein n=1 Tax=Sneathiella marina TaxID=2950108 RepID=A0ABY4VXZ9_9PROT|nr:VWA domain-containing protein [Sneathiella marina]USG59803.1 VWA domain-containing protein [Sneathiella marina]